MLAKIQRPLRDLSTRVLAHNHKTVLTLADQALVSGTNFMTGVLVARALGVGMFGVFSLVWLAVLFAQSIQLATIISPMMSIGPKQNDDSVDTYYSTALLQQLILCLVIVAVTLLLLAIINLVDWVPVSPPLAVAGAACVIVTQLHEFTRRYNFTIHRPLQVLVSDGARNLTQLSALYILLFHLPTSLRTVNNTLYVVTICAIIGLFFTYSSAPKVSIDWPALRMITRRHYHLAKWLLGSAILQWTTGNFFVIAAGALLGPTAVGALKAAQNLIAVTHIFFQAAENIGPPHASRIFHTQGLTGLRRFVNLILYVGGAGTLAACLLTAIPAKFWLTALFGRGYSQYALLVQGFALSYFLTALSMPVRFALLALEQTRAIFVGYIISALFTLAACYPLIHYFGAYGALIGIIVSQGIRLANTGVEYRALLRTKPPTANTLTP